MSKTIPYDGEFIPSNDFPAPMRVAHVTIGYATTNDVVLTSTGDYALFTVPANCVVHDMLTCVTTAFTNGVITLGDSDDVDGYATDTSWAPASTCTTVGVPKKTSGLAGAYANGKYYSASQAINAQVTTAAVTVGAAEVFLLFSMALGD